MDKLSTLIKINEIRIKIINEDDYFETMNMMPEYFEKYEKEISNFNDIDFIDIEHPIYSKVTDKQYIFNVKNSERLKKILNSRLDDLLNGADSLIHALNELDIKTASTDQERLFIERKIKLKELLIKADKTY